MASNYKFSDEEIAAIKAARRETKDKRADARSKAQELRAEGMKSSEVAQATGFHAAYVTTLVAKYRDHGLEAISGNYYGSNHRNLSVEEEATIPFARLPLILFSALPDAIGLLKRLIRF